MKKNNTTVTRRWIKYPTDLVRARFHVGRNPYSPESPAFVDEAWIEYAYLLESGEAHGWSMKMLADRWQWKSKGRVNRLMVEVQRFFDDQNGTTTERERNDTERPRNEAERTRNTTEREAHQNQSVAHGGGTNTERSGTNTEHDGTTTERLTRARASSRSKIREERENKTETEEKTPQPPKGADVVSLFDGVDSPSKRTRTPKGPAPFPDRLAEREDAAMWFQVWPSLTKSEQARIWEAVELWDKFTDVFQRIKNATLEDVRAMLQIRSTGIYTLDDLHEGIQGVFVMASEKGGQWVYSSGAFMPRKLFSEKGKLEQGRQIWANVTGAKHSKTDDLGRMQHGFTMSEHDFFYGPGGKK